MNIKLFAKITFAIALTAFAFAACNRDRHNPDDPNYNGRDPQPSEEVTAGLSVKATYFGDYYENGYHDYILLFQLGEIGEDGYFKTSGVELSLEVLSATGGATLFPAGIYDLTDDQHNAAGIVPSKPKLDEDGNPVLDDKKNVIYEDTYLYTEQDADNYWLEPLEAARLEVEMNGAQYTMKVKVKVNGEEYSYLYKGALPITDESNSVNPEPGEDGPDGDYDFKADQAYARNLGRAWDDEEGPHVTDDWEFEFYNSKNDNEWMSVEIIAPAASNIEEIPTGTFSIPANFDDPDYVVVAGNMLPPYLYDGDYCGTFYAYGEYVWYTACSGSIKITKSGDNYTFELSFKDDGDEEVGYAPARVTMTYTGKVVVDVSEWWDEVEDEEESGNMMRIRKAVPSFKVKVCRRPANKRPVKAACRYAGRLR